MQRLSTKWTASSTSSRERNIPRCLRGGWNDPRVAPWEPGKFVAALQAASTSGKPVLLKVNYDNGHFTEEKIVTFKNFAGPYAFMLWQTGHKEFQPAN